MKHILAYLAFTAMFYLLAAWFQPQEVAGVWLHEVATEVAGQMPEVRVPFSGLLNTKDF